MPHICITTGLLGFTRTTCNITGSVQFKVVPECSEMPHYMHSTTALISFSNSAFETVLMFIYYSPFLSFEGRSSSASSFYTCLLKVNDGVMNAFK